jgi:hypothetical protein
MFNKYGASVHCVAAAKTLVETSSLQNFLRKLHAMNLMASLVVAPLMHLMMIVRDPLFFPYIFFISSANAFYFVLSSRNYEKLSPRDGIPVRKEMSSASTEKGSSTHRYPPWVTTMSYLTQLFTLRPLPKCGISNGFIISVLASLDAHYFGWKIGSPKGPIPMLSR